MLKYTIYKPTGVLRHFVNNYIIVENDRMASYQIVMKPNPVMAVQYGGGVEISAPDKAVYPQLSSGILGVQYKHRKVLHQPGSGLLFVNFREAAGAVFFRTPAYELTDTACELEQVATPRAVGLLEKQIRAAATAAHKVQIMEHFLLAQLRKRSMDPLASAAVSMIREASGMIRSELLAAALFVSMRKLENNFRQQIGISPKKFASIVRLEHTIRQWDQRHSMTQVALQNGYYDQSHFIREIRTYTGLTPKKFFATLLPPVHHASQLCGFIYRSTSPWLYKEWL